MEEAEADMQQEKFALQHMMAVLREEHERLMLEGQAEFEKHRETLSSDHLEQFH